MYMFPGDYKNCNTSLVGVMELYANITWEICINSVSNGDVY
jgi:hypothetical protein